MREQSQLLAKKLNRLIGINAPEFFDERLFTGFINGLVERNYLIVGPNQELQPSAVVYEVLDAAQNVINPQFRRAVLRSN